MSMMGRAAEINLLDEVMGSTSAEMIALYGRRRVGKTYLISEYFKNKGVYFELTGRKEATKVVQLKNFTTVYADLFNQGAPIPLPADWDDALTLLRKKIESLDPLAKVILFFDELPWLASRKSGFLEALDLFWNRYISRRAHTILIVSGSATAWISKKIILNKAGLHNRLTRPAIALMPFTLKETELFLHAEGVALERKQIIDLYMALGGIPYYLKLVPKGQSVAQILASLFFSKRAPLATEFHNLFASLYEHPSKHIAIIKALAETRQGLTQGELFEQVKTLSPGGGALALLEELESSGFIMRLPQFGKKKKEARLRLIDPFILFYIHWLEKGGCIDEASWMRQMGTQRYQVWSGFTFENICFQHYRSLLKALELSVVAYVQSGWTYVPKKGVDEKGTQVDLVIDRADQCINLCEIKFYESEVEIDKSYATILRRKKTLFKEKTGTRKTLFTTLITPYGVKKNTLYFDAVDLSITMDALF